MVQRGAVALVAIAVIVIPAAAAPPSDGDGRAVARGDQPNSGPDSPPPNFVVIMTDDQTASTSRAKFMPRTRKLLAAQGTTFKNFVVTTPLCCPSRAGFYTGQYAHNNGDVFLNRPGYKSLDREHTVLPVWLRDASYRTALVGKFMHGYPPEGESRAAPAPGYTDWYGILSNNYYGYRISENGEVDRRGHRPADYATNVINDHAVGLIRDYAEQPDPFFIHVSHIAPHSDEEPGLSCSHAAIPAPRDRGRFSDLRFPNPPSFGEPDASDKPSFIRRLARLTNREALNLKRKYRCRASSLRQVDRGVRRIVETLERTGELDETAIIFTGDNGYFLGEHRLRRGKGLPYEEAIRQPLMIRLPSRFRDGPRVRRVTEVTANIDLAPTLLDLAGTTPCDADEDCRTLDGRSLIPLLEGGGGSFADRGVLIEYRSPRGSGRRKDEGGSCEYAAIRTADALYVEHTFVFDRDAGGCVRTKEVEHYDLLLDRFQLDNLSPPSTLATRREQERLAARLDRLRGCSGTRDGTAEKPNCE
jgi:N-acetylglucosamine-6-sulfatase